MGLAGGGTARLRGRRNGLERGAAGLLDRSGMELTPCAKTDQAKSNVGIRH